jgi:crotonobetainyl-CoA:carnitine CoA-transferase CaiB-like acyl-CoA transferase
VLAQADCCATIVASLDEALADPHFVARGLFAHRIVAADGSAIPALPVPVAAPFRDTNRDRPADPPKAGLP